MNKFLLSLAFIYIFLIFMLIYNLTHPNIYKSEKHISGKIVYKYHPLNTLSYKIFTDQNDEVNIKESSYIKLNIGDIIHYKDYDNDFGKYLYKEENE